MRMVFFGACLFCAQTAWAQEEVRYQDDSTQVAVEEPQGSVQVLRLKQGYQLGDGITLRSPQGNWNLNQTLQTVYSVSSAQKDLSMRSTAFLWISAKAKFLASWASPAAENRPSAG